MTTPAGDTTNVAADRANVGFQAQAVHGNVTVYQLRDDSPEEKFRVGMAYLDSGMPTEARQLIGQAIANGYETSKVHFHWILALLSRRTFRQFSDEDFSSLREARKRIRRYTGDQWSDGLKVINNLLSAAENPEADIRLVRKELDELAPTQRDKIVIHLEMFLVGPIEDHIWELALAQAEAKRLAHDRKRRVWMFFQPKPTAPRVRPSAPVQISTASWFGVAVTPLAVAAAGYIGWLLLAHGKVLEFLAYLAGIAAGYLCCFVKGAEWRHNVERLADKEWEHHSPARWASAPPGGFADDVDKLFSRYFAKYRPEAATPGDWRRGTAGIRRYLRDEIVETYREQGVSAYQIAWLIRYRIRDVANHWQAGTLWDYRDQLRTPATTKLVFAVGLALLVPSIVWAIIGAVPANPAFAILAAVLLAASGYGSIMGWLRVVLERRRYAADREEEQQRLAESAVEFARWTERLKSRPSDSQMATWLDCDRKCLMSETMRHYKLAASQIIAHAFIEAPARPYLRARVPIGPWRYSRYQLMVFLLTADGVRQLSAILDFQKATFHDRKRINYRFDAVASVQVTETDLRERTFELTLVNGDPIQATVTEASTKDIDLVQLDAESELVSRLTLDAAGLTNTLHVLEGVAAEGKDWIKHENQRRKNWRPPGATPRGGQA
jgi:hypothetical protein